MKKMLSVLLLFAAAALFAAPARDFYILLDTGKSMRNDGTVDDIYKTAGSYIASFIGENYKDKRGSNTTIHVLGVVKEKNEKKLLTRSYVIHKPGSELDLTLLEKINPNPKEWNWPYLSLDPNATDLDLFSTFFFDKANAVYAVITNSDIGKSSFFGQRKVSQVNPNEPDIGLSKAKFERNVQVFLIHLPNSGSSSEEHFRRNILRERISKGLAAAWNTIIYDPPQFELAAEMVSGKNNQKQELVFAETSRSDIPKFYAPITLSYRVRNLAAVKSLVITGDNGIESVTREIKPAEKNIFLPVGNLTQSGIYRITAEVTGRNGDVVTRNIRFQICPPLVINIAANQEKVKQEITTLRGEAPFKVNFLVTTSGNEKITWLKNGKPFNQNRDNVFNQNALVECQVTGLDGQIYSRRFKIEIVAVLKATANGKEFAPGQNTSVLPVQEGSKVKFEASLKNVQWYRDGKQFQPDVQNVFNRDSLIECRYTGPQGKMQSVFLTIKNTAVAIPDPVLKVTANGMEMSKRSGERELPIEEGKPINLEVKKQNNISNIQYFMNDVLVQPERLKATRDGELEVRAIGTNGSKCSCFISIKVSKGASSLIPEHPSGKFEPKTGIFTINTPENKVNVKFRFVQDLQQDDLKNYQVSVDGEKEVPALHQWSRKFDAGKGYQIKLYFKDKEVQKFTIRISQKFDLKFVVKVRGGSEAAVDEEDGGEDGQNKVKSLTLTTSDTVDFLVQGIKPGTNWDKLVVIFYDGNGAEIKKNTLNELKKEQEDTDDSNQAQSGNQSEFSWSDTLSGDTDKVVFIDENSKFKDQVKFYFSGDSDGGGSAFIWIIILILLGGGGAAAYIFLKKRKPGTK